MSMQTCGWVGCGKLFEPVREGHVFCGSKCRMGHANDRRKVAMGLLKAAVAAPLELEQVAIRNEEIARFGPCDAVLVSGSTGLST